MYGRVSKTPLEAYEPLNYHYINASPDSPHTSPPPYHIPSSPSRSIAIRNLTPMRLGRNQKEILELHTLRRGTRRKSNSFTLSEEKRNCIPQFHTRKVDTNTGSCAHTERMERCFR